MRIPNKFNGYLFDGTRNLHDPVTVAAGSTLMAPGVAAGAGGAAAASAMGIGALGTGLAAGSLLAGGGSLLGGLGAGSGALSAGLGGIAPSLAAEIAPAAIAQSVGATSPALAQSLGLDALKQQVVSQGVGNQAAAQAANLIPQAAPNVVGQNQLLATFQNAPTNLAQFPQYQQIAGADQLVTKPFVDPFTAATPTPPAGIEQLVTKPYVDPFAAANPNAAVANQAAQVPAAVAKPAVVPGQNFAQNAINFFKNPSMQGVKDYASEHPYATTAGVGLAAKKLFEQPTLSTPEKQKAYIRPYTLEAQNTSGQPYNPSDTSERNQLTYTYTPGEIYEAGGEPVKRAVGGPIEEMSAQNAIGANQMYPQSQLKTDMYSNPMMQRPINNNVITGGMDAPVDAYTGEARFAEGGDTTSKYAYDPVTQKFTETATPVAPKKMGFGPQGLGGVDIASSLNNIGNMGGIGFFNRNKKPAEPVVTTSGGVTAPYMPPGQTAQQGYQSQLNVPAYQTPEQQLGLNGFYDYMDQQMGGMRGQQGYAGGGMTQGHLGGYSDGGRLLRGPGDGVSDSIPAVIGRNQPARLADGEFVVPARIVSELGNGSTEAGARKLYAMMDRIQKGRKKSVGKNKVAVNSKSDRHLPA